MPRETTWDDLEGENAFQVMGTIGRLLRQLERGVPELDGLRARYIAEATAAGGYEGLMDVSHRYAREYLQTTLHVPAERT